MDLLSYIMMVQIYEFIIITDDIIEDIGYDISYLSSSIRRK